MDQITPKAVKEFKIVGTRPLRPDGIDKVTGKAMYGADLYAPNMLYACSKFRRHVMHSCYDKPCA